MPIPPEERRRIAERLDAVLALAERPGTAGKLTAAEHAVGRIVIAHAPIIREALAAQAKPARQRDWREMAERCLQHQAHLRYMDCEFLVNIAARDRPPTAPQAKWLYDIADRLGV
jgi:hypothetical protein